jgi:predicted class III extradiol MEMO1 family dioxygenase
VAVLLAARRLGARDAVILKYGDSGDVSGDKASVVGYLAAALGRRSGPDRRDAAAAGRAS